MTPPQHNPRKKDAAPLEEALKDLWKAYSLEEAYQEKLLIASWPELMGKSIADRTGTIYIKNKKLFVSITSGPVKKELQLSKSKVLALIETKLGKGIVEDLAFL
ncbi:MAG: DUF721 domain-containing protein [Bacteroidota bacterium]|jgi:predicted nucleic acid-binding Zn ribbon protein